jgi:lipoprotein-releasing system permease protein
VIGAIVMMILDKKDNLKTLFSLGATIKEIKKIFVYQGFLLTFFGLILGLLISISLVIIQKHFGLIMITSSLAYPVQFKIINVLIVFFTIILLGYLAAKIASSRISNKILQ